MLRYVLASLALFGAATTALLLKYEWLNRHGAHGVGIVATLFWGFFLGGTTFNMLDLTPECRFRVYSRYVSFLFLGHLIFFGTLYALRQSIRFVVFRYLPPSMDDLAEVAFILAFLVMLHLLLKNGDRLQERYLDGRKDAKRSSSLIN